MKVISLAAEAEAQAVGGKAAALYRLLRHGVRVPQGFCVTVQGLERLESDEVEVALAAALAALGGGRVAVRSSAVAEDGGHQSYAGVFRTVLDVPPQLDDVRAALQAVRLSLYEASATSYRQALGLAPSAMAAIVQPMIEGESSGVMFTRDPVTGDRQLVIEAVVTGGAGSTEYVVLNFDGVLVTPAADGVSPALAPLLPALADAARACEEVLGEGQDIEWAARGGDVWILQSRPISSLT
ncbi:PEP/pyruvate-binding domain-containing protein [Micromonospora parva]|uniref:PEP/pyruvate-binding domain-containing protein n=1 Tax=Micromonospora parva TaxID=1464048 RepID=UPI0037196670